MTTVSKLVGEGSQGILLPPDGPIEFTRLFLRARKVKSGPGDIRREIRRTASDEGETQALALHKRLIPADAVFPNGRSLLRWRQDDVTEFLSEYYHRG